MPKATPKSCMDAFMDAMIRRDMPAALALLTDDVALFYSNGTALWGKEQFASAMTANWKLVTNYKYTTLDSIWLAQSDIAAAVIYTFAWSGVADGKDVSGGGRGTRVFRKVRTGGIFRRSGWRIAHEHLSAGQWKPSG
jgi:ketosteroid isomerase-like protein